MMEVPEVTDGQQEHTEVSVTEGVSERSLYTEGILWIPYQDEQYFADRPAKTREILAIVHLFEKADDQTYPYRKVPFVR